MGLIFYAALIAIPIAFYFGSGYIHRHWTDMPEDDDDDNETIITKTDPNDKR